MEVSPLLCEYNNIHYQELTRKGCCRKSQQEAWRRRKETLHYTSCGIYTSKRYYQSSHCVRCFCKNEENKLKPEWMSIQRIRYSWRSLRIIVEISNEKNWKHCWYRESIFTNSPSIERKRRYQILMVKGYKTTSITQ